MDALPFLDATAQADLVRRKELTSRDLVEAAIARIERLNPHLNAVITPLFDQAREAAGGSLPEGPFTGVPFLLKDLMAEAAGTPHGEGSAFLDGHVSAEDSELVRRYRRAGLVIVGKTNTPELGLLPTTEPRRFGPTRNPWDRTRSAGGSSGGSAAAVAAGLVPAAHGNDGGGSIRIPAACCGVFGLKPTRRRTPLTLHPAHVWSVLVVEHALTRSVRDSAALLDATAGPVAGDPHAPPPPRRPFRDEVGADPGRLRVALTTMAANGAPVHPDCVDAAQAAAALCAELGHEVVEAAPALEGDELTQAFMTLWAAGCAWTLDEWGRRLGRPPAAAQLEPFTWALYQMGKGASATDYLVALEGFQRASERVGAFFAHHDVWLTPTLAEPPLPLGAFDGGDDAGAGDDAIATLFRAATFTPFTPIANITGHPAMSLPLAWNAEGLPIGVHVVGRFGDEATMVRLASQLEAARPWVGRRPPLAGAGARLPSA